MSRRGREAVLSCIYVSVISYICLLICLCISISLMRAAPEWLAEDKDDDFACNNDCFASKPQN